MIHVLLVEDQQLFREGIKALIHHEEDLEVVGMAETADDSFRLIEEKQPHVVLMDLHIAGIDGVKATRYIKDHYPGTKVILLTTYVEEDLIIAGLNADADGFLFKNLNATKLIQAIRDAFYGDMVISGQAARILARRIRHNMYNKKQILARKLEHRSIYLTEKELDIAYLMMEGKANKVIAEYMYLSEGTIKNYISDIYTKVNMRRRSKVIEYFRGFFH
ncbi:DNA-binding response regulator [Virgibacillus phasianinus]|uniref:DNA-binding response regulator n=1 Tax=Virgibacillus phasianinus TaxID=2017483 RepID=A0A220U2D1_9BACI|nr:response regulator transcription factor [Virgibacillus phasianinus]ASK62279.1 DNA-binding response regulator [Virgibacillus phasianinus]